MCTFKHIPKDQHSTHQNTKTSHPLSLTFSSLILLIYIQLEANTGFIYISINCWYQKTVFIPYHTPSPSPNPPKQGYLQPPHSNQTSIYTSHHNTHHITSHHIKKQNTQTQKNTYIKQKEKKIHNNTHSLNPLSKKYLYLSHLHFSSSLHPSLSP